MFSCNVYYFIGDYQVNIPLVVSCIREDDVAKTARHIINKHLGIDEKELGINQVARHTEEDGILYISASDFGVASLDELQPGDVVIHASNSNYSMAYALARVERVTKTMIILENGKRFSNKSAGEVGRDWNPDFIYILNDQTSGQINIRQYFEECRPRNIARNLKRILENRIEELDAGKLETTTLLLKLYDVMKDPDQYQK